MPVQLPCTAHSCIQYGKQVRRLGGLVTEFIYQRYRFAGNMHSHLLARLMTAVNNRIALHVFLAQVGQVYERHTAKQKHQYEIRKNSFLFFGNRDSFRIHQPLHLLLRQRPFDMRLDLGINIIKQLGVIVPLPKGIQRL